MNNPGSGKSREMNILFASSISHWGGGENWMLSAAEGMRDRGHRVFLAARPDSELFRRALAAGFLCEGMDFKGDLDLPTSWRFFRLCRREKIDVFCLNMQKVLRIAGPAARLAGVGAVVPRVGNEISLGRKISHVYSWRHVASGTIANSRATRRALLRSAPWLPPDRVRVIYNGVRLEDYADSSVSETIRAELQASPGAPVIGMIGALTQLKNHVLLLRQLPVLVERFPDLQLWIAGEGDQREVLQSEAQRLGVASHLRLLGFRTDVPGLIAGVDLLAHPSLTEGFGYVLVEAMAAGKPVVATDTSNIPEIVVDGETGFLCPLEDEPSWARRCGEILADPELARRLGEAGGRRARELFSFERMIGELEAYFSKLIA